MKKLTLCFLFLTLGAGQNKNNFKEPNKEATFDDTREPNLYASPGRAKHGLGLPPGLEKKI